MCRGSIAFLLLFLLAQGDTQLLPPRSSGSSAAGQQNAKEGEYSSSSSSSSSRGGRGGSTASRAAERWPQLSRLLPAAESQGRLALLPLGEDDLRREEGGRLFSGRRTSRYPAGRSQRQQSAASTAAGDPAAAAAAAVDAGTCAAWAQRTGVFRAIVTALKTSLAYQVRLTGLRHLNVIFRHRLLPVGMAAL